MPRGEVFGRRYEPREAHGSQPTQCAELPLVRFSDPPAVWAGSGASSSKALSHSVGKVWKRHVCVAADMLSSASAPDPSQPSEPGAPERVGGNLLGGGGQTST
jgi:hypothetical protein